MKGHTKIFKLCLISCIMGLALPSCSKNDDSSTVINPTPPKTPDPPTDEHWTFESTPIWADEFDYDGAPNPAKWNYETGGSGFGNNELEYYTTELSNSHAENGMLMITAIKEDVGGRHYTSARLNSSGKGDWTYGRFEIKAQLPAGVGTWPAIWMLPTDWAYGDWPKSGEYDIMEHVGYDQDNVHASAHTESYNHKINTQKTSTYHLDGASTGFHLYRVDWTPYAMRGYVDDHLIFTFVNDGSGYAAWPFDKKFHMMLNLAIGGDWGGAQGVNDSIFPVSMLIDYVRVYKMVE